MPIRPTLAIVMISLNEAHNMRAVLENISDIADEVFLLDSFSQDDTVDIALDKGVKVYQRAFKGFGDQWNYAISELPITSDWTMKLDPDERLTEPLKNSIREALQSSSADGFIVRRNLWFMGKPMPVNQDILRIWKTRKARFSDVLVNEHPIVEGEIETLSGSLEHHDSPNLDHWFKKQNIYTTMEAKSAFLGKSLAETPKLFGNSLQRRMWLKAIYPKIPLRHLIMFFYCYFGMGAWRAGRAGFIWSRLRGLVFKMREMKREDMKRLGSTYPDIKSGHGDAHMGAIQCET